MYGLLMLMRKSRVGLPNYAMQRTGTDQVPGRGRLATALIQASYARELMRWRAVADGGR
jgi:hypothetical protein